MQQKELKSVCDTKQLACDFVEDQFNKVMLKKLKEYNNCQQEEIREEIIDYCYKKAWNDAMARERFVKDSSIRKHSDDIMEILKNCLPSSTDSFKYIYRSLYENDAYGMRCGVWQKFINMLYKYFYCIREYGICFSDNDNLDFSVCHMPLDSYILSWYYDKIAICSKKKVKWNNITIEEYEKIQENIKVFIENSNEYQKYTVLEAEFIIWNEMKQKSKRK